MTREQYNAELKKYQQMEAESEKLEKDKKRYRQTMDRTAQSSGRQTKSKTDAEFDMGGAWGGSSVQINYQTARKKQQILNAKMEQSRKRLANYKGE